MFMHRYTHIVRILSIVYISQHHLLKPLDNSHLPLSPVPSVNRAKFQVELKVDPFLQLQWISVLV